MLACQRVLKAMPDINDIWPLAHNILRSARQMINEELRPLNLSSSEGNILLHLLTRNQILGQEDLVEQLDISKPAVSRALESLELKGYIVRQVDPADKRAKQVLLTNKAKDISARIEVIYNRIFSIAAKGVTEEEIQNFIELFSRVSESFSRARADKKVKRRHRNDQ
jgi:MarR family transcriptional regulator, transcriptional regulator for hemolysin